MRLKLVPSDTSIDFLRHRASPYLFHWSCTEFNWLVSIKGLNLGIDFRGGILIEARNTLPADISGLRRN